MKIEPHELKDGGCIEPPTEDGRIKRLSRGGAVLSVRRPQDDNYAEWMRLFYPNFYKPLDSVDFVDSTDNDNSDHVRATFKLNNIDRAEQALFSLKTDPDSKGEPAETVIIDSLANLMHLCRMSRFDFVDLARQATDRHGEEDAGCY